MEFGVCNREVRIGCGVNISEVCQILLLSDALNDANFLYVDGMAMLSSFNVLPVYDQSNLLDDAWRATKTAWLHIGVIFFPSVNTNGCKCKTRREELAPLFSFDQDVHCHCVCSLRN